jgi:hypothetical protein
MPTGPESAPIDPELLDAPTEPELLPDPEVLPDPELLADPELLLEPEPLADPELLLEPELLAPELELLIEAECREPASSGDVLELPEVTLVSEEDPSLPPASAEPAEPELQAKKTVVARIGQKPRGRTSKARFGESTQSTNTLRVPFISSPRSSTISSARSQARPVPIVLARDLQGRGGLLGTNGAMRNVNRDATLKAGPLDPTPHEGSRRICRAPSSV